MGLKTWVWPILSGFIAASVIMLVFEWVNHFIFPLPAGLDTHDTAAVQAFTATLPWKAYILVFVGWALGSFGGGYTTAWLAGEKSGAKLGATGVLTAVLLVSGIADMTVIGFPAVQTVFGILILAAAPFLGRLALHTVEAKKLTATALTK